MNEALYYAGLADQRAGNDAARPLDAYYMLGFTSGVRP